MMSDLLYYQEGNIENKTTEAGKMKAKRSSDCPVCFFNARQLETTAPSG